jgi:hypothetical protein
LALNYINEANSKTQLYQSFYLNGSNERLKILEAYCLTKIGEKEKAKQLKDTIQLEQLDSFCKEYDSIFYYALEPTNCPKETIQQIENLGYSRLFALI